MFIVTYKKALYRALKKFEKNWRIDQKIYLTDIRHILKIRKKAKQIRLIKIRRHPVGQSSS